MPERLPRYRYELHNFITWSEDDIQQKLTKYDLDYRDIVSITYNPEQEYYVIFYGVRVLY